MNEDIDAKLGRLLRGNAPAERDPLFRIRVLEHRERQRYQQRQRVVLMAAVALAVLPALVLALAGQLVTFGPLVLFGGALVTAAAFALRGVRRALRWLRAGRM